MLTLWKTFVAFAIAMALIGFAAAQSRRKPPNNIPPQKAAKAEHAAQTDKRGTPEQLLTINIIPATEQRADAEKEKTKGELKTADDRKLVEYTGYLVFVGAVQLGVFVLQLIAFSMQARYMHRTRH